MKIPTKHVQDGNLDGKTFWICHYNRPDLDKKPLRNVPPTKVLVVNNNELPKNKTVYYSNSHFRPLNKKGDPLSKVISPVDNTGFRSLQGNPLFVYDNEKECVDEWNSQLQSVADAIEVQIQNAAKVWKTQQDQTIGMMI